MDKRIRAMRAMRRSGATYQTIGQHFGMSRQRVHQLIGIPSAPDLAIRLVEKFPDFPVDGHPDDQQAWLEAFPRFVKVVQGEGDGADAS